MLIHPALLLLHIVITGVVPVRLAGVVSLWDLHVEKGVEGREEAERTKH